MPTKESRIVQVWQSRHLLFLESKPLLCSACPLVDLSIPKCDVGSVRCFVIYQIKFPK